MPEVPERSAVCARNPRATTDSVANYLRSIGYHLETPNPLQAQDGQYSGSVTYTVGNGQQIDLGQGDYSDSELTLQLLLDVVHDFKVRFASERPTVKLARKEAGHSGTIMAYPRHASIRSSLST